MSQQDRTVFTTTRTLPNGDVMEVQIMRRSWNTSMVELNKKPRVYVGTRGETLLDNIANRTSRPVQAYRKVVLPVLAEVFSELGFSSVKFNWSQNAGCSMCPCSPGFIVNDTNPAGASYCLLLPDGSFERRYDVWVTITATAEVPATTDPELAEARVLSVLSDPTIPEAALVNTIITPARTFTMADFAEGGLGS